MDAATTLARWTALLARDRWHNSVITTDSDALRGTSLGTYAASPSKVNPSLSLGLHSRQRLRVIALRSLTLGMRRTEWR